MASDLGCPGGDHSASWRFQTGGNPFCNRSSRRKHHQRSYDHRGLDHPCDPGKEKQRKRAHTQHSGAGALAGAALYSFFTATLALGSKKE